MEKLRSINKLQQKEGPLETSGSKDDLEEEVEVPEKYMHGDLPEDEMQGHQGSQSQTRKLLLQMEVKLAPG
jgi:hypothetical protein